MDSNDSDSEWSDVADDDELQVECMAACLFCEAKESTVEKCFLHMSNNHKINIKEIISSQITEFYEYIKFINYIRKHKSQPEEIKNISKNLFTDDIYLQPVLIDDLLLQFDVDTLLENAETDEAGDLKFELASSKERANLAVEFLGRTLADLNQCRKHLNDLMLGGSATETVSKRIESIDNDGYFGSYAHYGIHEEMLKDKVRTESYKDFILKNSNIFNNANVLDVGCGTSILSMFAAKAGAKKVTGIDYSEIAYQAMDIVKENKLDHVITIVKGKAEDVELNHKVDVIISEWMGYFLIFESMLDTVIYCRDNYLTDNGCIYPDKCNIKLVALDNTDLVESKIKFWENVYGFKMSCMKSNVIEEPLVQVIDFTKIISEPYIVIEYDLMKVKVEDLDFDRKFQLEIKKSGVLNAIVGYFDIGFVQNTTTPIYFSTSPYVEPTHWKQTVFLLKENFNVNEGDVINGRMFCKKNKKDHRALDIAIIIYDEKYENVKLKQYFVLG